MNKNAYLTVHAWATHLKLLYKFCERLEADPANYPVKDQQGESYIGVDYEHFGRRN